MYHCLNQLAKCISGFAMLGLFASGCHRQETQSALPKEEVQISVSDAGQKLHLGNNGVLYRESDDPQKWVVVETVYDPEEMRTAFTNESGKVYRVSPDNGQRFEVLRAFAEGFEDLPTGSAGLKELIGESRQRWGSLTLQSPQKPTVAEYVELRQQLIAGTADFVDARVEVTSDKKASGNSSLRCEAPARTNSMVTCKASLSSPLLYFKDGDDFWFEASYLVEDSYPLTLADLECEFVRNHPGIRLRFYDNNRLGVELKALDKPQYRQDSANSTAFPKGQWVLVRAHFHLSAFDGLIEVWQDGKKIIDAKGATLPFPAAIYSSLEIGASAFSELEGRAIVYVDELRIRDREFER